MSNNETNILIPAGDLWEKISNMPAYSNAGAKKRDVKRAEKFFEFIDCAVNYANIIENNSEKEIEGLDLISVDQSLNGAGICFSTSLVFENNPSLMIRHLVLMSSCIMEMLKHNSAAKDNDMYLWLISELPCFERTKYIDSYSMSESIYLVNSLMFNLNIIYDSQSKRLCFCTKVNLPAEKSFGYINKLSLTNSALTFFVENIQKIFMLLIKKFWEIRKEKGDDIFIPVDYNIAKVFMSKKTFRKYMTDIGNKFDSISIENSKEICSLLIKRFKNKKTNPIISLEEVSSSENFIGLRANAMSFASCSVALMRYARERYNSDRATLTTPTTANTTIFQPLFFLLNKKTLDAFCSKVIQHIYGLTNQEQQVLVPDNVKESKAPQYILMTLFTGVSNIDSDICDAFCHNVLMNNYYTCLKKIIDLCLSNLILTKSSRKLIEDENNFVEYTFVTLGNRYFESSVDLGFKDFDVVMSNIFKEIGVFCKERFLDYDTVISYLFSNFANQMNRFFRGINEQEFTAGAYDE